MPPPPITSSPTSTESTPGLDLADLNRKRIVDLLGSIEGTPAHEVSSETGKGHFAYRVSYSVLKETSSLASISPGSNQWNHLPLLPKSVSNSIMVSINLLD